MCGSGSRYGILTLADLFPVGICPPIGNYIQHVFHLLQGVLYLFLLPLYYIKYSKLYSKGLNYVTFN